MHHNESDVSFLNFGNTDTLTILIDDENLKITGYNEHFINNR